MTYHVWVSVSFLIADHPPYNVWVERGFAEQFPGAIREIDKKASRPICVALQGPEVSRHPHGHS